MAMRNAGSAEFATRRSSAQPSHLGRQGVREPPVSLTIDEDQLRRIEIALAVEPAPPAISGCLGGPTPVRSRSSLNDQPWPRSQSINVLRPMRMERSASRRPTISFSVMSLRSPSMPKTKSTCSSRREPPLRPCGRGDNSPIFARAIQRIALHRFPDAL